MIMSTTNEATTTHEATTTQAAPADTPQPAPTTTTLTPEAAVEALRTMRAELGVDVTPLTVAQRKTLRDKTRMSNPVLQASINVIGALDNIAQAIGQPASDVRQMCDDANRWSAVEDEVRSLLNGIASANLVRRQRIALIAAQAGSISKQLVRDPANAVLVPHVQELKRLKSFARRKKPAQAPGTPQPPASGTTQSSSPGTPQSPVTGTPQPASGTPQPSASGTTAAPATPVSQVPAAAASHQA
jgi:hypothetical protein